MPVRKVHGSTATYLAGGTRNGVKLNRPWQPDIAAIIDKENCPFCNRAQNEVPCTNPAWRTFRNNATPHAWHFLIIPKTCADATFLKTLGGPKAIEEVIRIAVDLLNQHDIREEVELFVHVGGFAGQNLGHLHCHLTPAVVSEDFRPSPDIYPADQVISHGDNITVAADGLQAGQVMFAIGKENALSDIAAELAETMSKTVNRAQKVLTSTQGHEPHFSLTIRIDEEKRVRVATYIPIVNFWGGSDRVAFLEGGPVALPWAHEETAELFRGE